MLLIGNGAIIRSCNGIDFNVNFHFVIILQSVLYSSVVKVGIGRREEKFSSFSSLE